MQPDPASARDGAEAGAARLARQALTVALRTAQRISS